MEGAFLQALEGPAVLGVSIRRRKGALVDGRPKGTEGGKGVTHSSKVEPLPAL